MRLMKFGLAVAAAAMAAGPAHAQLDTAALLKKVDAGDRGARMALEALTGGIFVTNLYVANQGGEPAFCAKGELTSEQTTEILRKFAKAHPQTTKFAPAMVMLYALIDAFPCTD